MPHMTRFEPGVVVVVEFPFSDLSSGKRRPGVVLASDDADLLIARLTTQEPRDEFDVSLADWAAIGLPRPSTVRVAKLLVIDRRLVQRSLGRLAANDKHAVAAAAQRLGEAIARSLTA